MTPTEPDTTAGDEGIDDGPQPDPTPDEETESRQPDQENRDHDRRDE
jgi:hypothetical protein